MQAEEEWTRIGPSDDLCCVGSGARGAVAAYQAALAIVESSEARPGEIAQIRWQLARALAELGQDSRAVAMAKQARDEFLADATDHPADVRAIEAWLSERGAAKAP